MKHFRNYLREKDDNCEEMGDHEVRLEFVLDVQKEAFDQKELIKKYFSLTSGLSLIIDAFQTELAAGILNPKRHFDIQKTSEKLIMVKEDIKKVFFFKKRMQVLHHVKVRINFFRNW